jgi:glycosyltransferase A (GT-A) superfamily protein (DUF2064 family)
MDNARPPNNSISKHTTINSSYQSQSNNLSNILSNVVRTGQNRYATIPTTVILFGMDAPEIPMHELYTILTSTSSPVSSASVSPTSLQSTTGSAFLCPAYDGGYVMLSIPPLRHSEERTMMIDTIFQSVSPYWSHPLTAVTQIKALSDVGISTIVGPIVHDIDTPDDVVQLIQRLKSVNNNHTQQQQQQQQQPQSFDMEGCCLCRPSILCTTAISINFFSDYIPCQYTRQALIDLQLW